MAGIQVNKLHTLTGHRDCVYTLQSGPKPSLIFSAAGDGLVVKWDLDKPEEGERIAQLPIPFMPCITFFSGNLLIVGHNYEGIHVLDWTNKKEVASLKISEAAIFDILVLENQCFIASGDGSVVVVDLKTMNIKKRLTHSEKNARTLAVNIQTGNWRWGTVIIISVCSISMTWP